MNSNYSACFRIRLINVANSEVVHVQEPLAFLHKETTAAKFLFCWLTQLVRVSKSRGNTAKDKKR